jgi:hypothetical protein
LFFSSALDGGELQTSHPNHLTPGKGTPYPLNTGLSGVDWTIWRRENLFKSDRIQTLYHPAQSDHYTNYAIPAPQYTITKQYKINYISNSEILKHLFH